MSLTLYSAATAMDANQKFMDITANNLANSLSTGFKKSKAEFQDVLYQKLVQKGTDGGGGISTPVGVEIGNGVRVAATPKIFTQGVLKPTGEDFDIALAGDDGKSFFEVQLPDGASAYTRDGALKVDRDGQIVNSNGYLYLSGFQAIPPGSRISVAETGDVTVTTPAGTTQTFRLNLVRFTNPVGLDSIGNNLYKETEASGDPIGGNPGEQGFGIIRQGVLELSNVSAVEEMVSMIVAQRAFEMNSKAIQSGDDMLSKIANVKR